MKLPIWQVDAFATHRFEGNPAAVVLLDEWLAPKTMQAVAMENNLSETAFLVPNGEAWGLKWFTPTAEVDLCGHATLASAHVLFHEGRVDGEVARFESLSGPLSAARDGDRIVLDFPARPPEPVDIDDAVVEALGARPNELLRSNDLLAIFETEADVAALRPEFRKVAALPGECVIASAPGDACDFVSRYFAPSFGIDEDPATGSAHCILTPYWSKRLDKTSLRALQISKRGAELWCEDQGDRIAIAGRAALYMKGEIEI